jgi:hypothetical protein
MTPNKRPISALAAATALAASSMGGVAHVVNDTALEFQNLSNSFSDLDLSSFLFSRKPTKVERIAFPRSQRKARKNARRAHAAGAKNIFKK